MCIAGALSKNGKYVVQTGRQKIAKGQKYKYISQLKGLQNSIYCQIIPA